jgi:hypothetical protein
MGRNLAHYAKTAQGHFWGNCKAWRRQHRWFDHAGHTIIIAVLGSETFEAATAHSQFSKMATPLTVLPEPLQRTPQARRRFPPTSMAAVGKTGVGMVAVTAAVDPTGNRIVADMAVAGATDAGSGTRLLERLPSAWEKVSKLSFSRASERKVEDPPMRFRRRGTGLAEPRGCGAPGS